MDDQPLEVDEDPYLREIILKSVYLMVKKDWNHETLLTA
jgi:hypothetical protein